MSSVTKDASYAVNHWTFVLAAVLTQAQLSATTSKAKRVWRPVHLASMEVLVMSALHVKHLVKNVNLGLICVRSVIPTPKCPSQM